MRAGIALGSNLGNRHAHLTEAILQLRKLHERGEFLCSSCHETKPLDCPPESTAFLNVVIELETSLQPLPLLDKLFSLEIDAGRMRNHAYHAPRTLDLDLLYCDNMTLKSELLEIPHPRIRERYFVLKPLSEIRPNLRLSGWSKTCREYLLFISNKQYFKIH